MKWHRPLACCAWGVFALSFFLPAAEGMPGWGCAAWAVSATFQSYQELFRNWKQFPSDWEWIHFGSLTFANLFMVISPFLIWRTPRKKIHFSNWQLVASFTAFALVWSYFFRVLRDPGQAGLKIGFYFWILSFLLLFLSSTLRSFSKKGRSVEKQLNAPSTSRAATSPTPADT